MNPMQSLQPVFGAVVDDDTAVRLAAQRLRSTLRLNAVSSGLGGLLAAAAPGLLDRSLDTGQPGWVRSIGAGLIVFAAAVFITAGARLTRLLRFTPIIVAGDAVWVASSAATISAGWYSSLGAAVVGAVAVMVACFAALQAITWRRTRASRPMSARADGAPPVEVACGTAFDEGVARS